MALTYAVAAKVLLDRSSSKLSESLAMIGVALTFVTIAIPIQLRQNWITIAWSVEALVMLLAGIKTRAQKLRAMAYTLFALTLIRLLLWDTPRHSGQVFTPVLNKYFLSSMVVTASLFGAAMLFQKFGERKQSPAPVLKLVIVLVAIVTLWFVMSVETLTYFASRAAAQKVIEDAAHEQWLGQMALSVLWSCYAGTLAAIGFVRRSATVRWAALVLFALSIIKAMIVDIAQLQQLYRIIVFFVLGVLVAGSCVGLPQGFSCHGVIKMKKLGLLSIVIAATALPFFTRALADAPMSVMAFFCRRGAARCGAGHIRPHRSITGDGQVQGGFG